MDKPKKKPVILSDKERKQVIESKLSCKEIAVKFNIAYNTALRIRVSAGVTTPIGNSRKITDQQELEIINSNQTCVVLGKKYGLHPSAISKIRIKKGAGTGSKHSAVPMKQTNFEYENKQKLNTHDVLAKAKEQDRIKRESGFVAVKTGIRAVVLRKI